MIKKGTYIDNCSHCRRWAVVLVIPAQRQGDRLDCLFALVLTAVAMKFAVAEDLPKLPFLTRLDWYVLVSFFCLFLMAIEGILVGGLATTTLDDSEMAIIHFSPISAQEIQGLEKKIVYTLLCLWVLYHLFWVKLAASSVSMMNTQIKHNADTAKQNPTWNSENYQGRSKVGSIKWNKSKSPMARVVKKVSTVAILTRSAITTKDKEQGGNALQPTSAIVKPETVTMTAIDTFTVEQ